MCVCVRTFPFGAVLGVSDATWASWTLLSIHYKLKRPFLKYWYFPHVRTVYVHVHADLPVAVYVLLFSELGYVKVNIYLENFV